MTQLSSQDSVTVFLITSAASQYIIEYWIELILNFNHAHPEIQFISWSHSLCLLTVLKEYLLSIIIHPSIFFPQTFQFHITLCYKRPHQYWNSATSCCWPSGCVWEWEKLLCVCPCLMLASAYSGKHRFRQIVKQKVRHGRRKKREGVCSISKWQSAWLLMDWMPTGEKKSTDFLIPCS